LGVILPTLFLTVALLQVPQTPPATQAPQPTPTAAGAGAVPDSLFPDRGTVMRLFTDCDEARWPFGTEERYEPKTTEELDAAVLRLRALEAGWRTYFTARAGDSIALTPKSAWRYPLAERGRLLNNFLNPRADGPHEALDIFVEREGVRILSPVSGVVVAAGDGWRGGYERRGRGFFYEGDGLSRRAGNAAILFDPESGGYFLFSHMQEGIAVRTGDVVAAGATMGRIGHTGNASRPGGGKHLHLAYKEPGTACGINGVLVAVNAYGWVRAARGRDLPAAKAARPARRRAAQPTRRP
jgi:murein DD-endopeptidase MepM/ murein hydrolase activator NlpD